MVGGDDVEVQVSSVLGAEVHELLQDVWRGDVGVELGVAQAALLPHCANRLLEHRQVPRPLVLGGT